MNASLICKLEYTVVEVMSKLRQIQILSKNSSLTLLIFPQKSPSKCGERPYLCTQFIPFNSGLPCWMQKVLVLLGVSSHLLMMKMDFWSVKQCLSWSFNI